MAMTAFGYLILISIDCYDCISSFSPLVLVLIETIYQTLKRVFHQIYKHLKVRQKYSTVRRIFNSLLDQFGNLVKHGLWCQYITSSHATLCTERCHVS